MTKQPATAAGRSLNQLLNHHADDWNTDIDAFVPDIIDIETEVGIDPDRLAEALMEIQSTSQEYWCDGCWRYIENPSHVCMDMAPMSEREHWELFAARLATEYARLAPKRSTNHA